MDIEFRKYFERQLLPEAVGAKYFTLNPYNKDEDEAARIANYISGLPKGTQKHVMGWFKSIEGEVNRPETKKGTLTLAQIKEYGDAAAAQSQITYLDPVEYRWNPEKKIRAITNVSEEREWLRKLVLSKRFQEEDITKFYTLFRKWNDINLCDRPEGGIPSFVNDKGEPDDASFHSFIMRFEPTPHTPLPNYPVEVPGKGEITSDQVPGVKLIDMSEDGRLYLFMVDNDINWKSEGETIYPMSVMGPGCNWCTLHGYRYRPNIFFCFILDGIPIVLIHWQSGQIKDCNNTSLMQSSPFLAQEIDDMVQKHHDMLFGSEEQVARAGRPSYQDVDEYKEYAAQMKADKKYIDDLMKAGTI